MIKRINEIKNVGAFTDFVNGASIGFDKLTFIYGLNTMGKTTLTDVFLSLKNDDSLRIQNRLSIPSNGANQIVKIGIAPTENERETSYIFRGDGWNSSEISKYLYVFGTEFIYKNLFTGLSIERGNKENLTQFIIGEEGVELANSIAERKKNLRKRKKDIINIIPPYVKGKPEDEIKSFIELKKDGFNENILKEELTKLESKVIEEKKRLDEPQRILSLPQIIQLVVPENRIAKLIEKTNLLLNKDYQDISELALRKVQEHVDRVFEEKEDALRWIKEGIDLKKPNVNNCTFCDQPLSNAKELIEAYHSYFNESYRKFIKEVKSDIDSVLNSWETLKYNQKEKLLIELNKAGKYESLINDKTFNGILFSFRSQVETLYENDLNESIDGMKNELEILFSQKKSKPYESLNPKSFDELNSALKNYYSILQGCADSIEKLNELITNFRKPYLDQTKIKSGIEELEKEIFLKKEIIARIEQDEQCKGYEMGLNELIGLDRKIKEDEEKLSTDQSDYLDSFFNKINFYFKKLGSSNFSLKKTTNRRGDQPVYSLLLKFKGTEITDSNVGKVLSESDRRALALSVFWSKIDLLEKEQKSKAIIILDDPITSFDDNRILLSIDLLKKTLEEVTQIIILTHYPHFVRRFCNRTKNSPITKSFIDIKQDGNTSKLVKSKEKQFTLSQYEKVFNKINGFILREHSEDIRSDLRPFLESLYLPHFFIKQLQKAKTSGNKCETLSEKINAIFEEGDVKKKFHNFREMLNPDSHLFTDNNEEDIRSFASNMMDYLYNFEYVHDDRGDSFGHSI